MKSPRKPFKFPSIYFCLVAISFGCLYLPERIINALSANTLDFQNGHILLGVLRLISYQFMHAGIDHFRGNFFFAALPCMYLEKRLGKAKFLSFYLFAGMCSGLVFIQMMRHSILNDLFASLGMPLTLVGASGSIFGCLTLALVLWGAESVYNRLLCLLVMWLMLFPQIQNAMASLHEPTEVAYWGHVGGMLSALIILPLFLIKRKRGK